LTGAFRGASICSMNDAMESNRYLWQPRKNGPIQIRVSYTDENGKRRAHPVSAYFSVWSVLSLSMTKCMLR
jgi:hypothetical protein